MSASLQEFNTHQSNLIKILQMDICSRLVKRSMGSTFVGGCILMQETMWYVALLPWECKVVHPKVKPFSNN